jgi:hypothetical protein
MVLDAAIWNIALLRMDMALVRLAGADNLGFVAPENQLVLAVTTAATRLEPTGSSQF